LEENSSNLGNIELTILNSWTLLNCQWSCQSRNWCASFNFNKKFQYCLLYKSMSANKQLDPYFISGPKTCGNNGRKFKWNYCVNAIRTIIYLLEWKKYYYNTFLQAFSLLLHKALASRKVAPINSLQSCHSFLVAPANSLLN